MRVCTLSRLLALGGAMLVVHAASAADLYKFSTTDSNVPANDDGYDPAAVSITADPNVSGPTDGTALAAQNVGLSRFWNTEFAGFSASSANGTTLESTEFGTGYFQFTLSGLNAAKLRLSSLAMASARGGGDPATQTRGFKLYAAVNGQAFSFNDTPILDVPNESGIRTAPTPLTADLSGPAYQDVSSVAFRYYPLTPATGNTMDFTGFTITGTTVGVPEPTSAAALAAVGLLAAGLKRRRRAV